jgi:ribose/xylose/arabinose/galactoside ABC-type transport system permease subunit
MQAILFILIALIVGFLLKYTRVGRYTYAIGGNEQAARLSGINVKWMKTLIYVLAGVFSAFAGIIMATHLNVGEANIADGTEMDCIAAAVIGGTSLQGGKGTVLGTVIGVLIIGIFGNLLNLLNVPGYSQSIFKGVIVVGAALLQTMQEKQQN